MRVLVACLLAFSAPPLGAQSRLWSADGDAALDLLGWSVAAVGDVDGDGWTDLAAGAWQATPGATGYARLYSGASGALLVDVAGSVPGGRFGNSVGSAADRDGDGARELLVGAPRADFAGPESGSAYVVSSLTGMLLARLDGDAAGDRFGFSVADAGDVDGDGVRDHVIGAPGDDTGGPGAGSARVLSGANGALLWRLDGLAADELGWSVAGAGDVDGDGRADVVVGARQFPHGAGVAHAVSGATGLVLYTVCGDDAGDELGFSVAGAGDVDGDGLADVVVGAPSDDPFGVGLRPGTVSVYVGPAGTLLQRAVGINDDALGTSVTGLGDVDGDGRDDYASGARHDDLLFHTGRVHVFSGASGEVLQTVYGDREDNFFGSAVAGAGPSGDDGAPGFFVGAFREDSAGDSAGRVVLFTTACLSPRLYCEGAPNSVGAGARIGVVGSAGHVDGGPRLVASGVAPGRAGLFLYARSPDRVPFGDGFLCLLAQPVGIFRLLPPVVADAAGSVRHDLDLLAPPAASGPGRIAPGSSWSFQLWYRDPGGPGGSGFNTSDAVRVTFCR